VAETLADSRTTEWAAKRPHDAVGGHAKGDTMLYWSLMFLLVALVAAVFGFGGIAAGAAGIAKVLFIVFLVLAVVSAAGHAFRGGMPG
jgi:uncharacterized membrane protein YtjA (UPF0391 family)